jgi:hypothetical protein
LGVAGLLILLGVAATLWQRDSHVAAPVAAPALRTDAAPAAQANAGAASREEKVVVDYTLFSTVEFAENTQVVTGWKFASSTSKAPELQYCYVRINTGSAEDRTIHLIQRGASGEVEETTAREVMKAKLPQLNYESALQKCRWFPG